jgi:FkbM family methyltransferase
MRIKLLVKSKNFYKRIKRNIEKPILEKKSLKKRVKLYSQFVSAGDLCFDVGANMGNRIEPLLTVGAKVVAIEPQEKCYRYLQSKFGSKIQIVTKGLGDKEGFLNFYISNASTISSFSKDWIDTVKEDRFKNYTWNTVEKIEITTLDNLIKKFGIPNFIKIDVEGFEYEVLKGLSCPVNYISFEYTIPEQLTKAIDCIKRIKEVNPRIECNYSIAETMEMELDRWLPSDAMIELIQTNSFINTSFGDIYVRSIKS